MEVLPSMESHFCYTLDFAKRTISRGAKPLLVSTYIIMCDAKLDLVGENAFRNPRIGYCGSEYLPRIGTSHCVLRNFYQEYPHLPRPGSELLMEDYVSFIGVWGLRLCPPRIPSHLESLIPLDSMQITNMIIFKLFSPG